MVSGQEDNRQVRSCSPAYSWEHLESLQPRLPERRISTRHVLRTKEGKDNKEQFHSLFHKVHVFHMHMQKEYE
jgi:hypothetical protein